MTNPLHSDIKRAAEIIRASKRLVAFTGAGISVESGIAPFRGPGGLWETHDPDKFHKQYFMRHPEDSWQEIRELFYEHVGQAKPNKAHLALAKLEQAGRLQAIITQNIDSLHYKAGSREIYEFHGSLRELECLGCGRKCPYETVNLETLPPHCRSCGGLLKPDIVFFGEPIPEEPMRRATKAAHSCDVMLIIGSTGEVQPAARLPHYAKNRSGATVIEVNIRPSAYTDVITDIFLQGPAAATLESLKTEVLAYR